MATKHARHKMHKDKNFKVADASEIKPGFYIVFFSHGFHKHISKITKDKFSSEVYEDKAERIFF